MQVNSRVTVHALFLLSTCELLLLAACGGGEESSGSGGAAAPTVPPIVMISATPAKILPGQSVTLNWTGTNATSCTAGNAWSGSRNTTGNLAVGVVQVTSRYELTCSNSFGSTTAVADVAVLSPTTATVVQLSPTLPASVRMKAARVQSSMDESALGEAVTFAWSQAGHPSAVFIANTDGKTALAGYPDAGTTEISARSTAIVMGRLGLAAVKRTSVPEQLVLNLVSNSGSLEGLTSAIATALESGTDPWESPAVVAALAVLIDAVQSALDAHGQGTGSFRSERSRIAATTSTFVGEGSEVVKLVSGRTVRVEYASHNDAILTNRTQVAWAISSSLDPENLQAISKDKYVEGVGLLGLGLGIVFDGWDVPSVGGSGLPFGRPYFVHVRQNQKTFWDNTAAAFLNMLDAALTISGLPSPAETPQCNGRTKDVLLHYIRTGLGLTTNSPLVPGGSITREKLVSMAADFAKPFAELAYDCVISDGLSNLDFRSSYRLDQLRMRLAKLNTVIQSLELVNTGAFFVDYFSSMERHSYMQICIDSRGNALPCEGYAIFSFSGQMESPAFDGTDDITYYSQSNRPPNNYTNPLRAKIGVTAAPHYFCRKPDGTWIPKTATKSGDPVAGSCSMPAGANMGLVPCSTTTEYSIGVDSAGTFSVSSSWSRIGSKPMTDQSLNCGGTLSDASQSSITLNLSTGEASATETRSEEYVSQMSNGVNCLLDIHRIEKHSIRISGTWRVDANLAIETARLVEKGNVFGAVPQECTDPTK